MYVGIIISKQNKIYLKKLVNVYTLFYTNQ